LTSDRFVNVGREDSFVEGRGRRVTVGPDTVAVIRHGGRLYALRDACPHMGASLADGQIVRGRVTCFWHGWTFDLATGQSDTRPWACARTYEIALRGGDVWIRVPDPPPEPPEEEWVPWDDGFLKR
jgi:nitrite reductase (NADH) small subunit/3-phenylpropionate/trans-cinnamate dioxygenase ferredoxin subunit